MCSALFHLQYHDWVALEQDNKPPTPHQVPQHKCLPTAPGVCSRCVCSLLCVPTLDGLIAQHKFRVLVTILGRMSRHFHFTFISRICIRLIHRINIRTENVRTSLFQMWNLLITKKIAYVCSDPDVTLSTFPHQRRFYKCEHWRGFKRTHTLRSNLFICTLYKWDPWCQLS